MAKKQKWFYPDQNKSFNLKIKVNGKRLYETNSVKYLGIRVDNKLN